MGTGKANRQIAQRSTAREQLWRSIEVARAATHERWSGQRPEDAGTAGAPLGPLVADCCDQALSLLHNAAEPLTADEMLMIVRAIGSLDSARVERVEERS